MLPRDGRGRRTAEEMARWIIALQQARLLASTASLATLWTPGRPNDRTIASFGGHDAVIPTLLEVDADAYFSCTHRR